MSKRRNLDDYLYGDRSSRAVVPSNGQSSFGYYDNYDNYSGVDNSRGSFKVTPRCHESHPALKLPGSEHVIYGGSCSRPIVKDADVYIGFDPSMAFTPRHWPWKKGNEVLFAINDMGVPKSADEFKKLVKWTRKQLDAGLKVHCGCIGGHGRTGMFLAALVSDYGEKDAIKYVRQHYCHKAVESTEQCNFLKREFGIKIASGTKSWSGGKKSSAGNSKTSKLKVVNGDILEPPQRHRKANYVRSPISIWGPESNA